MAEVLELKRKVDPDVVKAAEKLLEDVKAGIIISFNCAMLYNDGAIGTTVCASPNAVLMLAAMNRLMHRVNITMDREIEE